MDKIAKILIIDDDENIRKALVAVLEDEGYAVESVDSGKKGIEKTETEFFNLALIDVRLPDMEGVDLLPKMRETSPKIRKIIITGYPTLQNAAAAVNKGADAYIMKPFDMEKMLQTIKDQLKKQSEESGGIHRNPSQRARDRRLRSQERRLSFPSLSSATFQSVPA